MSDALKADAPIKSNRMEDKAATSLCSCFHSVSTGFNGVKFGGKILAILKRVKFW